MAPGLRPTAYAPGANRRYGCAIFSTAGIRQRLSRPIGRSAQRLRPKGRALFVGYRFVLRCHVTWGVRSGARARAEDRPRVFVCLALPRALLLLPLGHRRPQGVGRTGAGSRAGAPAPRSVARGAPAPSRSTPRPMAAPRHGGRGFGRAVFGAYAPTDFLSATALFSTNFFNFFGAHPYGPRPTPAAVGLPPQKNKKKIYRKSCAPKNLPRGLRPRGPRWAQDKTQSKNKDTFAVGCSRAARRGCLPLAAGRSPSVFHGVLRSRASGRPRFWGLMRVDVPAPPK